MAIREFSNEDYEKLEKLYQKEKHLAKKDYRRLDKLVKEEKKKTTKKVTSEFIKNITKS